MSTDWRDKRTPAHMRGLVQPDDTHTHRPSTVEELARYLAHGGHDACRDHLDAMLPAWGVRALAGDDHALATYRTEPPTGEEWATLAELARSASIQTVRHAHWLTGPDTRLDAAIKARIYTTFHAARPDWLAHQKGRKGWA